jgi:VCBS repeat-containing protein
MRFRAFVSGILRLSAHFTVNRENLSLPQNFNKFNTFFGEKIIMLKSIKQTLFLLAVFCIFGIVSSTHAQQEVTLPLTPSGITENLESANGNIINELISKSVSNQTIENLSSSSGTKVLLVAADNATWVADVYSKLLETGLFAQIDIFNANAGTPTLAQLQQYDSVLTWSNICYQNNVSLGNNLADYADGGGGVVVATFSLYPTNSCVGISGRLSSGGYLPFTQQNYAYCCYGEKTLIKDDALHPILSNVNSFNGGFGSYITNTSLTSGASLLAHWNTGEPLVAVKPTSNGRVVGLNLFPPSNTVFSHGWKSDTDGARLMGNSLVWAANQNDCNSFKITSLTANNAVAIEHNFITGDDRGGIAVSNSKVFYTGDNQTGRFDISNLANGNNVGIQRYDGIVSDLKTGKVYTLANGNTPLSYNFQYPFTATIDKLLEIDGTTGSLTGSQITLSTPISLAGAHHATEAGIFAGYGRVVLLDGTTGAVHNVDLPSGSVSNLGTLSLPSDYYTVNKRMATENWATWGVAEFFDNSVHLAYVQTTIPGTKIVRTRVSDGSTTTIATFSNLSEMASITVAPSLNRWYFHHEGGSQFRSGDETIGFADATFSIGSDCTASNTAPVAAADSYTTNEDTPFSVPSNGVLGNDTDQDSNTLSAVLVSDPSNEADFTLNADGSFNYTPNSDFVGTDSFTYMANDGQADSNVVTVTITVNATNDAPTLLGVPAFQTIDELTSLNFTAGASDVDSPANSLQFILIGAPEGAGIDGATGAFSWTPTEAQGPNTYLFTVKVADDQGATSEQGISVTVNEVNVAPQIANVPASAAIDELSAYSFTATATDSDSPSQTLTFSLVGAPAGAEINPTTGAFSWTPTEAQGNGSIYNFSVRVSDGVVNTDTSVALTVNEVNGAPDLEVIADQTIDELTQLSIPVNGSDPDDPANTLTYSLDTGFPDGMTIDSNTGAISWTPTEEQGTGDYPVTVRVTDNGSPALSGTITFNVHVNEVNVAPELAAIGNKTIDEQVDYAFNASATDADLPANNLTYSLIGAPMGASITQSGAFSWTPDESQGAGSYTFTVKVTDDGSNSLSDEEQITITVNEVNRKPVLNSISNQSGYWGNPFIFTATASDPDLPANLLTFSLIGAPTGAVIDSSTGAFLWTPNSSQLGSFTFAVRVKDNGSPNMFDDKSVTISVGRRPTATVYTGDGSEQYSDKQALTATLTDNGGGAMQGNPLSNQTINFLIGSQNASNGTNSSGVAATDLILTQNPAPAYNVVSSFAGDSLYEGSGDTKPFDITQEDARIHYTGMTFVNTSCATCGTAATTLSATVRDITAETADAATDSFEGDISYAKVTFVNRDASNAPIAGCVDIPVQLVSGADTRTGTVTCNWSANIGSADSDQFTIGIVVSNYYNRNASTDNAVVTVSKPLGTNFITGGGFTVLGANSAGQYAGGVGLKTNFGFNVKYNNSGKNLQGRVNVIVRAADGKVYQIKGNQMDTLTVNNKIPTARTAIYTGKANVTDITDPLNPISLGGGHSFQMKLTDKGEAGSTDTIGITLFANGSGALLFSSYWDGTNTVEQILGGGNLQVR